MNNRGQLRTADSGQDESAKRTLSAREAAAVLGVAERTIRRAIARGEIVASKQGRAYQISADALMRYRSRPTRVPSDRSPPRPASILTLVPRVAVPHVRIVEPEAAPGASLPRPPTTFVGREREAAAVKALIESPDVRLVTLTGPGGVGKTRLAIEVAASLPRVFADGVVFVGLAALSDAALVIPTIAQAVGVREEGVPPLVERLAAVLRSRNLLLVLDNCEHVVAAATQIADLLAACPNLTVLATSREPLRIAAERQFAVPPLQVEESRRLGVLGVESTPSPSEALRLFIDRAHAVLPDFRQTSANRAAIAEICRRLDGLPLAIELAAARVKAFPLDTLLARLERRLPLLTGGPRDAPPRQRTMRDAIAWSYDLLDPAEQALFRRLSVFAGGFTLEAAEYVGGIADELLSPSSVLDSIVSLVDKNLVRVDEGFGGDPRYSILETVREFGLEELAHSGEVATTHDLHAAYSLSWSERLARQVCTAEQILALDRFEADHDNARVALDWLLERGDAARAAQLVDALHWFWYLRGHPREGHHHIQTMLAMPEAAFPPLYRGRLLVAAGMYPISMQNSYVTALALCGAGVEAARAVGDQWTIAWGNYQLGRSRLMRGELGDARVRLQESARLFRQIGHPWGAVHALSSLGLVLELTGDPGGPAMLDESVNLARALGDPWSLATCHGYIGDAARVVGDTRRGRAAFVESLRFFRLLGYVNASGIILYEIGSLALLDGDLRGAASCFTEALDLHLERGRWHRVAHALAGLAKTAWHLGRPAEAARLIGAAQTRFDAIGLPLWTVDREEADRLIADLRRTLGDAAFTAAWDEGYTLSTDAAIAAARAIAAEAVHAGSAPAVAAEALRLGLTPREAEVLRLLARRLTDREIAETLFISPKTAGKHVGNILAKLQAADRRQAAALAELLGLD